MRWSLIVDAGLLNIGGAHFHRGIAQWLERFADNKEVVGSTPTTPTQALWRGVHRTNPRTQLVHQCGECRQVGNWRIRGNSEYIRASVTLLDMALITKSTPHRVRVLGTKSPQWLHRTVWLVRYLVKVEVTGSNPVGVATVPRPEPLISVAELREESVLAHHNKVSSVGGLM